MIGDHHDDANATVPRPSSTDLTSPSAEDSLVRRVERLEEALVRLSKRVELPEPVADPLAIEPPSDPLQITHELKKPADPVPIPRAMPILPVPTASLAEFALPQIDLPPPVPDAADRAIMRPIKVDLPLITSLSHRVLPPSALVRDLWWDLRTALRMLRDPYYPMTVACKIVPLAALFYVCVWPWFSAWTGLLGTILSGLVNIVVLYITFKVIQRELRRYYEFSQRYRRP
jgi:hypothetical protein